MRVSAAAARSCTYREPLHRSDPAGRLGHNSVMNGCGQPLRSLQWREVSVYAGQMWLGVYADLFRSAPELTITPLTGERSAGTIPKRWRLLGPARCALPGGP